MKFEVRYGFVLWANWSVRNVVVSQQPFQWNWSILLYEYYTICSAEILCCSFNKEVTVRHSAFLFLEYLWSNNVAPKITFQSNAAPSTGMCVLCTYFTYCVSRQKILKNFSVVIVLLEYNGGSEQVFKFDVILTVHRR